MNQEKKNKREKRVYDEAFRREAVALLQSSDEPLVQIAAELG
jgi:transposase-like protein